MCGGEALPQTLADALLVRGLDLWNLYGPTEATIWATTHHPTAIGQPVRIGRPMPNVRAYVLDTLLQPVPIGVPGELWLGGHGLARGYHGRPDLTAERFVADPFASATCGRMYRTGDRARWHPDGMLEYLGRTDYQIKLRGHRIELGEIEAVLLRQTGVKAAVVTLREDVPGYPCLVGYVVTGGEPAVAATQLREELRQRLPAVMVPSAIEFLDALPLTPNGKVDRKALPAPEASDLLTGPAYQPPVTTAERLLVELFEDVLKRSPVGIHDNFFDLGGHSLLAMRVLSRVADRTGARLPLRTFFDATTLAALAATIDRESAQPTAAPARIAAVSRGAFRRSSPAGEA